MNNVLVYNFEKYLNEFIESILLESINPKEIILINDGSKDNSKVICDEYDKKYDFIIVIHKNNEGLSKARNDGINYAKGEYIFFVDSDDFLLDDYVLKMYDECKKNNLDIIRGAYYRYDNEKKQFSSTKHFNEAYYNKALNGLNFLKKEIKSGNYEVISCMGLFRREYIIKNKLKFTLDVTYEDHEFF
ncbi:glycosyltransferase family 2 protein [Clostridium tarantellae]|nr:glycosyltransferase family 2 protein [Clostridium tarantellae]